MKRNVMKIRLISAVALLLTFAVAGVGCHGKSQEETSAPTTTSVSSSPAPDDPAGAQAKATAEQNAAHQSQRDSADAEARKATMQKAGQK